FFAARHLHASAAATSRSFDDDRVADFLGYTGRFNIVRYTTIGTGDNWNAKTFRCTLGFDLVAHNTDMRSGGAYKGDAVGFKDFGEFCILRKETITRMDRISASDFTSSYDLVNVQIAVARGW